MNVAVKLIPLKKCITQHELTLQRNIPKSNVHWWLHMEGGLKPHSSALNPVLTEQNKYSWLLFALDMVNPSDTTKFQDMYNFIHVDEKWFYLPRDKHQFLLVDGERPPQHL